MSSVTWQVVIVSILAAVTGYYIKVGAISSLSGQEFDHDYCV